MASNIVESVTRLPFNSTKFNQRFFDYDPDFIDENYENKYGKIKDSLKHLLNGFFEYYHKVKLSSENPLEELEELDNLLYYRLKCIEYDLDNSSVSIDYLHKYRLQHTKFIV